MRSLLLTRFTLLRGWIVVAASLTIMNFVAAQTVSTTLQLSAPNDPINVISLELSTDSFLTGSDSDTADLTGSVQATFDVTQNLAGYEITTIKLTGGLVSLSDVNFGLGVAGSVNGVGMGGTPFTCLNLQADGTCLDASPGPVSNGVYDATQHGFVVNQGTVDAAGTTIDFAASPFTGLGQGNGVIVTSLGSPIPGFDVLNVELELPISFSETFEVPTGTFLGSINATLSGTGTIKSSGSLQIPVAPGLACDADGDGDCELDDIDAMYSDIAAGTQGNEFDFNGDGTVTADDIGGWLTAASDSANTALLDPGNDQLVIGDLDLNGDVNSVDLGLLLNNFNSASGVGWGGGDLDADLLVNSVDLGLLLNTFGHSSLAANAVPEPSPFPLFALWFAAIALTARHRSAQR